MKKYTLLALSLVTIVGLVGLSSCSKDDPAPRPQVSFERSTQTISENAGVVEIKVVLDQAAGEDIIVEYDVDGTALEGAASTAGTDYEITSGSGEVEIKKGQTSGIIELKIKNDTNYEGDETIGFEITSVSSSGVDITDDNTIEITISEDDPQPIISFTTSTSTVNEDIGLLEVEVSIDREAPQDITVTYQVENESLWLSQDIAISGDYAEAQTNPIPFMYWDFIALNDDASERAEVGTFTIPQGETSAKINLYIISDFRFEDPEALKLTLTGANGGAAIATAASKKTTTITIEQQDGRLMELDWESTSANLDLYLWGAGSLAGLNAINENTLVYSYANYAQKPTDPVGSTFENVFVPANVAEVEPDTKAFGVSIVYRSGTVDPLAFTLHHVDYINGAWEPLAGVEEYDGTYALDNINSFPTVLTFPAVVQTFEIVGGEIANVTALDLPDTGSRVSSSTANAKPRIITHNTGKKKLYLPVASSTVTSAKTLKRTPRLSELRRR